MSKANKIVAVRAGELRIHPVAQRRLVPAQLKKRMADLDLDAIGVLHGVEIADAIYIIDGQHRVVALQRHGFDDWRVRVELHPEASDPRRAHALFLLLNARTSPSSYDTFINELGAGDPVAVGVAAIAEKHGYIIERQLRDGTVVCVSAMKEVYKIDDGETLDVFFETATSAWGRRSSTVEGKLVSGISTLLARYNGEMDRAVFVKKLSKYPGGATGILGDAKGLRRIRGGSMATAVAEVALEAYNRGRRTGRLGVAAEED